MNLVHPVYVSPFDSIPLLIGKDLLNRFEPLIDFKRLKIWAQVREPLPIGAPWVIKAQCYKLDTKIAGPDALSGQRLTAEASKAPDTNEDGQTSLMWPRREALASRDNFLCSLADSSAVHGFCPQVVGGIELEDAHIDDVVRKIGHQPKVVRDIEAK